MLTGIPAVRIEDWPVLTFCECSSSAVIILCIQGTNSLDPFKYRGERPVQIEKP